VTVEARRHLADIPPCLHGSLSFREMAEGGISPDGIIDFSASCNPLGTAPEVSAALAKLDFSRYPDDQAVELRRALGRILGLEAEWIAVGNGSVELVWQLAAAYLEPGDPALVVGPTFGEYSRACRIQGARVDELRFAEDSGFWPDPSAVFGAIRSHCPKLTFLCNPNNPTGRLLAEHQVAEILEACENTLLVVDEAYLPFCDCPPNLLPYLSNGKLLLLRSMTKDHALAGLRLGYAVACPGIIGSLGRVRAPWSVNAAAQAAGLAALEVREQVEKARQVVAEARAYLVERLSALGLGVVPSTANFLLVRVGDGSAFRAALLSRGICVRDCASFGLPAYVRIGVRTLPECRKLVEAAREVLAGG